MSTDIDPVNNHRTGIINLKQSVAALIELIIELNGYDSLIQKLNAGSGVFDGVANRT